MTELQKRVKKELKELKTIETSDDYSPITVTFGDRYNQYSNSHETAEISYLLSKFPPCQMFKHYNGGCTAYYPTDKPQKNDTVKKVNPVRLDCDGIDSYVYTLKWYTKIITKTVDTASGAPEGHYVKVEVIINYGSQLITIKHKHNDSRQKPKYSQFKAYPVVKGLNPIMYYGDSGDYMTTFKCEVEDIKDKEFFIL